MIVTLKVNVDIELDLPGGPLSPGGESMTAAVIEAVKRSLEFSENVGFEHRLAHEATVTVINVEAVVHGDILEALADLYAECPLADYGDAIDLDLWDAREQAGNILKREGR